jgi:predicted nucleotidyltransferase
VRSEENAARQRKCGVGNAEWGVKRMQRGSGSAEKKLPIGNHNSDLNPHSIHLWGSLLHPEQFDENSDIDIAVEGLDSPSAWFALTGKALAMTNLPLDIVELEYVGPPDRVSIIRKGKLVHERLQSIR